MNALISGSDWSIISEKIASFHAALPVCSSNNLSRADRLILKAGKY